MVHLTKASREDQSQQVASDYWYQKGSFKRSRSDKETTNKQDKVDESVDADLDEYRLELVLDLEDAKFLWSHTRR